MNVLILHGIGGAAGENWGGWLERELVRRNYRVLMPTLPDTNHPDRQQWLKTIQASVEHERDELIIVGHSLGVASALDYLELARTQVYGLVSVSGFSVDYGLALNSYFLQEKAIDFVRVHHNLRQAVVIYGDNDPYVPQDALAGLARDLAAKPIIIAGGGHLNTAAGFREFPQLLSAVTKL